MLGLGKLKTVYVQGIFSDEHNNMTLGIHGEEHSAKNLLGETYTMNTLYIGIFFIRIVFEFVV